MKLFLVYAWKDEKGVDIDTFGTTHQRVKDRVLMQHLGWRYDHADLEEKWKELRRYGAIVKVRISECINY